MTAKKHNPSFEERLQRLQDIVSALENTELPLEQGIQLYKEGIFLSKTCREELEKAQHEITILTEEHTFEPFEISESTYNEDIE